MGQELRIKQKDNQKRLFLRKQLKKSGFRLGTKLATFVHCDRRTETSFFLFFSENKFLVLGAL